jgi:hypothetical protein
MRVVIPREPGNRIAKDRRPVRLQRDQGLPRIHPGLKTGGEHAGEHAGDIGAVVRRVEETIFPLANGQLQRPLRPVVLQGRPRDLQKPGQCLPMHAQGVQRCAQTALGLYGALRTLCVQPVLEPVHHRAPRLLMVPQASLGTHVLHARLFLMIEHLPEGLKASPFNMIIFAQ